VAGAAEPLARRFGEIAKQLMSLIRTNDEQSRTLAALRDTLLPKLLSGELRVKDVAKCRNEMFLPNS
jgi:type I restriction enzyme S subunit